MKIQSSKILLTRVRGHPFHQTPSPTDFVLVTIPIFFYVLCIYYQRNKCFENASKNIQNSKKNLPNGRGHPFPQTPSPTNFVFVATPIFFFIKNHLIHDKKYFSKVLWKCIYEGPKFKNFPTQGKGSPLPLDPIPHRLCSCHNPHIFLLTKKIFIYYQINNTKYF